MPDYKKISRKLLISLCEIADIAKAAIEDAEEDIISDEINSIISLCSDDTDKS